MNDRAIIWILIAVIIIERYIETVLPDKIKQKGEVKAKWLWNCLLITGFTVYVSAILEFIFVVKKINFTTTIIGVILLILRIALKIWVVKTLGKFWSIQIEIRKDQQLITGGPYRFMRHPSYFSTMIEANAGLLILNSYYTLLIVWFIYFPFLYLRMKLEEKELVSKFGKEYLNYQRSVFALLPIKRLKDDRV